ncbi:MAG TPA: xanthine dehydrogenase family protein subunit M [Chloroflexota bacterium]|nr:xanthine dehydrogenase family protein subunit M [Chloroflexota bacterium]
MKPAAFEYRAPGSVAEALDMLGSEHGDGEAKILAGGQSLVPLMNFRLARPPVLIDVNRLAELDYLREDGGWLACGALTRQRMVERSALVAEHCSILAEATRWIGHTTIRNRGTVGGSLAHNDPTAEYALLAVLLEAEVVLRSSSGTRVVPAAEFLGPYMTTALRPDELLTEVRWPVLPAGTRWAFQEFARRHGDFGIVAVAAVVLDGAVRVAVAGAGPVPFRATVAEAALARGRLTGKAIGAAAEVAAEGAQPESDIHASAEYRRHLTRVLTRRALEQLAGSEWAQ